MHHNIVLKFSMTFGQIIREARKKNKWSLRRLAEEMDKEGAKIDFTYLSRVENNSPEYPLSEEKIRVLARILDLDEIELIFAAEKIPTENIIKAIKNDKKFAQSAFAFFRSIKK